MANIVKIILTCLAAGFLSGAATLFFGGGFLPGLFFGLAISILAKEKSLKAGKSPYWIVAGTAGGYLVMSTLLFLFALMLDGSMRQSEIFIDPRFLGLLFFSSWIVSAMFLNILKKAFGILNAWMVFIGGLACALFAVGLIIFIDSYFPSLDYMVSVGFAAMIWQTIVGSILAYRISKPEITT